MYFILFATCFLASVRFGIAVVGGSQADNGQYPYQVSLRSSGKHFCGGSIINEEWILSSAGCVLRSDRDSITVVVGTNKLNSGGDVFRSSRVIAHPDFDAYLMSDDIGLVRVVEPIVFTDSIKAVNLPQEDFNKSNHPAEFSGWGTTSYPGNVPNDLQKITLNVIEQTECMETSSQITDRNICTLNKAGEGTCHGDSGGPLVAENVQIGVLSWGRPCAVGKPDVFTRVFSYVEWIEETMSG